MMRHVLALLFGLLAASPAAAANVNIDGLPAAGSVAGANLFECEQGGVNRQCTGTQIAAFIYGLMSADATATGGGALTLATVNGNVGSFGSATNCVSFTTNAKGLITAASQTTCTPAVGSITGLGTGVSAALAAALNSSTGAIGALTATNGNCVVGNGTAWTSATCPGGTAANPTATAGPAAVNGVATTYMRSDGAPAIQLGSSSQAGLVQVDNTTITAAAGVISTAPQAATPTDQTGANYAFQSTDRAKVVYLSNGSNQVPTIAAATGSFGSGWFTSACNTGAGTQTITPTTSTIGGAATFVLPAASAARPACVTIISDGTNYRVYPDFPMDASNFSAGTVAAARGGAGTINGALKANGSGVVSQAACADLSDDGALCSATPGTGVATAIAANLSAAGGLTTTVASGTSALGTSAISSQTCATAVTTTATNTATTDVVQWGFNGDPTATTGYLPTAMLTIVAYPTANNVNFKVCNLTGSSITPAAVTLNWRVAR
jgi:hypothetical protein